jgi:hypothetical protein
MRSLLLFTLLGLAALTLVTGTPSMAQAWPWHGGWRSGFYPQWWGRPYGYPGWGWGAYYPYPGFYYPYPAYVYPSYLDSYPFGGVSVTPASGAITSVYSNPLPGTALPSPEEMAVSKVLAASGVPNCSRKRLNKRPRARPTLSSFRRLPAP